MFAVAFRRLFAKWQPEEGQTMAEYGLILAVVAVIAVAAYATLGADITTLINNVAGKLGV
jgi:Flp pilus assembly pilin Flp